MEHYQPLKTQAEIAGIASEVASLLIAKLPKTAWEDLAFATALAIKGMATGCIKATRPGGESAAPLTTQEQHYIALVAGSALVAEVEFAVANSPTGAAH